MHTYDHMYVLMVGDGWRAHAFTGACFPSIQKIQDYLISRNVLPVYIPGGCTDVCQAVDFHFGAEMKRMMNEFYKVYTH